jgi:hypothetical protein
VDEKPHRPVGQKLLWRARHRAGCDRPMAESRGCPGPHHRRIRVRSAPRAAGCSGDLQAHFAADERAQLQGEPPATLAIVSDSSRNPASYSAADAVGFYLRPVHAGVWENKVTLISTR